MIVAKAIGCILGRDEELSSDLVPGDVAITLAAQIFGYSNVTEFREDVIDWVTNTNRDPDDGPVGGVFWALFFTPFGATCAGLNGTYRILDTVPLYSPYWLPLLPVSLGNDTRDLTKWLANRQWIVPDSMVLDPDSCYNISEICLFPFSPECPCSPLFENCGDRLGFSSPLDSIYFFLNWAFPSIYQSRLVKIVAMVTGTTSWLQEFTNVTDATDFNDKVSFRANELSLTNEQLYCFWVVGLPSSLWVLPLFPLLAIAAFIFMWFLISLAKYIALWLWALAVLLLFMPFTVTLVIPDETPMDR
jgi:hypothetical protein